MSGDDTGVRARLPELPAALDYEGRKVLAIPVGMSRSDFALAKLAGVRGSPGWVVRRLSVEPWRVEGFFRHDGKLYLYGPYLPGRFLEEELAAPSLQPLRELIQALLALQAAGCSVPELQTDGVCFLLEGGVLFLPPELMRELRALRPEAHRLACYQSINHPELRGRSEQLSFSLAALLHRLLLGAYPFQAATEEELRNRIRHQKLSPLALSAPGLRQEIAQGMLRGLRRSEGPAPSLQDWSALLEEAAAKGLYVELSAGEQEQIGLQARREQARAMSGYRRRVFWQRHWKTVLIVAAACAAAGGLGGSFLKNLLAPRLTRGFTPREVVESFYAGINSLDHALMEDCVVGRAGKETIREVINVFVMSRVRMGYEGKSPIVAADQWVAQGKPALDPEHSVYGITDLELRQEHGEPEPVFLAGYTKWYPAPAAEGGQPPPAAPARFESQAIQERLYLRQDRRDWVIYRIERL